MKVAFLLLFTFFANFIYSIQQLSNSQTRTFHGQINPNNYAQCISFLYAYMAGSCAVQNNHLQFFDSDNPKLLYAVPFGTITSTLEKLLNTKNLPGLDLELLRLRNQSHATRKRKTIEFLESLSDEAKLDLQVDQFNEFYHHEDPDAINDEQIRTNRIAVARAIADQNSDQFNQAIKRILTKKPMASLSSQITAYIQRLKQE